MASNLEDIRAWGAENNFDVSGERLPAGLRAAYDARESEERAPALPKPTVKERAQGVAQRVRAASPKKATASRVKLSKPRVAVNRLITGGWQVLASIVNPINPAVGRVLSVQAPIAGVLLEDTVKGTVVDRVLQPLARASTGGEMAIALIGPPLIVAALSMNPERQNVLVPALRYALKSWVRVAGPKMESLMKEQEEEEQYSAEIDKLLSYIFPEPPQGWDEGAE